MGDSDMTVVDVAYLFTASAKEIPFGIPQYILNGLNQCLLCAINLVGSEKC